jgi:hypothetical protein
VTAGSPPGTVGDYLDDVTPGEVVVLDNAGRVGSARLRRNGVAER